MNKRETRQVGWRMMVVFLAVGLLLSLTAMAGAYSFVGGGGDWNVGTNWSPVGVPGTVDNAYANGSVNTPHITDTQAVAQVYVGVGSNNSKVYIDSGGSISCNYMALGNTSSGFVHQYGNVTVVEVYAGVSAGRYGQYRLYEGHLTATHRIGVGWSGTGVFRMGEAAGAASISGAGSMYISHLSGSAGTFEGRGTVGLTGGLTHKGKVIANGFGTDRDLDMSTFSSVSTEYGGSGDGWYANTQGRLLLPSISVSAGNSTVKWGDSSTGNAKMVNSVQVDFVGATAGNLDISLLATNRTDVPAVTDGDLIGVWNISGPSFTSVNLTVRYDDALASSLGLTESDIMLIRYNGNNWVDITDSIDTTSNLISGVTGAFSMFAVGIIDIPERGAIIMIK